MAASQPPAGSARAGVEGRGCVTVRIGLRRIGILRVTIRRVARGRVRGGGCGCGGRGVCCLRGGLVRRILAVLRNRMHTPVLLRGLLLLFIILRERERERERK